MNTPNSSLLETLLEEVPNTKTRKSYLSNTRLLLLWAYPNKDTDIALQTLLNQGWRYAWALVEDYKNHLENGLASSTVQSRIMAIKKVFNLACDKGLVDQDLSVLKGVTVSNTNDNTGITVEQFQSVLTACKLEPNILIRTRDIAILTLLWSTALRRSEIARLNIGDLDTQASELNILGKGKSEPEKIPVVNEVIKNIEAYLALRADLTNDSPLFQSHDFKNSGSKLCGDMYSKIVKKYCKKAGIEKRVSTNSFRHGSITKTFIDTGGRFRPAMKLARHKSPDTTLIYIDVDLDANNPHQKEMSDLMGSLLDQKQITDMLDGLV